MWVTPSLRLRNLSLKALYCRIFLRRQAWEFAMSYRSTEVPAATAPTSPADEPDEAQRRQELLLYLWQKVPCQCQKVLCQCQKVLCQWLQRMVMWNLQVLGPQPPSKWRRYRLRRVFPLLMWKRQPVFYRVSSTATDHVGEAEAALCFSL